MSTIQSFLKIHVGFLMVFSAMIITNSMMEGKDWSSLLGAGVTFIIVGLIMVMVNRIISSREEEELAKYVSTRLARTKSGYHLGRDLEAGGHGHLHSTNNTAGGGGSGTTCTTSCDPQYQNLRVPRRAMSARVPPSRSPSIQLKRSASARRSIRGQRAGSTTIELLPPATSEATIGNEQPISRSPSTYSHLSVKNGNVPPPSYEDVVTYVGVPASIKSKCTDHDDENSSKATGHLEVTTDDGIVTKTVLEPKDNLPALTVTTSSDKTSSKSSVLITTSKKRGGRRTSSDDAAAVIEKGALEHQNSTNKS